MAKSKAAKPAKPAKSGGPKKSKLPRPVHSRAIAIAGLLALAPIAWMLLHGTLDLESAARRAVYVMIGLMLIERILAPLVLMVLNSNRPEPQAEQPKQPNP